MHYSDLVIDETPYCIWDWELDELDADFLRGLDPDYFMFMAESLGSQLEGAAAQHAALALRMTYSHAQETLMSLIAAMVQAPDCVVGWLHKYRNEELDSVVRKLHRQQPVPTKLAWSDLSWRGLSSLVHRYISLPDAEKQVRITEEFGRLWHRIAADFLDDHLRREYNSIKHGLRVRPGGFVLSAGLERTAGVPCPADGMRVIGGSRFGSSFYVPERVEGVEKWNIRMLHSSRNWLPEQLAKRIILMSMSMRNVLSFLQASKDGEPQRYSFEWPADFELFKACWSPRPGVLGGSFNTPLTKDDIYPRSKQQIMDTYQKGGDGAPTAP